MKWTVLTMFLGLLVFSACKKENAMSKIPKITLQSATDSIKAGGDTISIRFAFEDGDADLANGDTDLIVTCYRADTVFLRMPYSMPAIPGSFKDPTKGLKGVATARVLGAFFTIEDTLQKHADTVRFEVFIRDGKGNQSNIINVPQVLIYP